MGFRVRPLLITVPIFRRLPYLISNGSSRLIGIGRSLLAHVIHLQLASHYRILGERRIQLLA
jgi:hypothetical protein